MVKTRDFGLVVMGSKPPRGFSDQTDPYPGGGVTAQWGGGFHTIESHSRMNAPLGSRSSMTLKRGGLHSEGPQVLRHGRARVTPGYTRAQAPSGAGPGIDRKMVI